MPLVSLSTDLTTLRYGGDRPGGGWSGQPWIQSPNPDLPPNISAQAVEMFKDFYRANKNTSDFPIRGGAMGVLETPAGKIDRVRIGAFLADKTKGTIFKLKQQGLQLSNPNIQVPTILGTSDELPILETTRYYRPDGGNTLLQTQLQGLGFHIPRHGLSPILTLPFQSTYEYVVSKNNTALTNRLTILTTLKINTPLITRNTGRFDPNAQNNPTILGFSNKYGISPLSSQILNYGGGPGSVYGLGFTVIRRATDTTEAHEKAVTYYNAHTLTYNQIANQTTRTQATPTATAQNARKNWDPLRIDFRKQLPANTVMTASYTEGEIMEKNYWYATVNTGDPGKTPSSRRVNYRQSTATGIDRINQQAPFVFDHTQEPFWEVDNFGRGLKDPPNVRTKDIIKFGFECLSNDDPSKATALIFRAFLTNFSDNHQAELSSFKYLGRGETFRTYQGFDRSISFSFKIAAQSRDELQPLYVKLNQLISQLYPDYSDSGLMRGSVVQLTIGDYLYRVPGFLESVNVNVADEYPWEINLEANNREVNQVPQVVDVQCAFKPIHGFLPRRVTEKYPFIPFVGSTRDNGQYGWLNNDVPPLTLQNIELEKKSFAPEPLVDSSVFPSPIRPLQPNPDVQRAALGGVLSNSPLFNR